MKTATSLQELLSGLARERTLSARIRLLARSWGLLRGASPEDRERAALALGSRWIWNRLERLLLADGELSPWEQSVKRALERMGSADPAELRALAASIRSGSRRDMQSFVLRTLRSALEEEADEREQEPDEAGPARGAVPARGTTQAERAAPREAPAVRSHEERPEPTLPAARRMMEPAPQRSRAPAPRRSPPGPSGARAPSPTRSARTEASASAPLLAAWPAAPVMPVTPEAVPDTLEGPARPRGPALTARERLRLLRNLRDRGGAAGTLDAAGRAQLLDQLGSGWAARRALSELIRDSALDGLDEALHLIARLGSPAQRTWCLADLVRHWDLDERARVRVLAAAPTPTARRRLRLRLERRGTHAPARA